MSDETMFTGTHEVAVEPPGAMQTDQGLVLKWRRRGDLWEGLVTREVDGKVATEWLPALVLNPLTTS